MNKRTIYYYRLHTPGGCCASCPRGGGGSCRGLNGLEGLDADTLASLAAGAGFSGPAVLTAAAVALAESGGNPNAHCYNCVPGVREDSRGLWQINVNAHPEFAGVNLYDPAVNAAAAFAVSGGGVSFRPWSTYKSGSYRSFLGLVSPIAPSTLPAGDDSGSVIPAAEPPLSPAIFGMSPMMVAGLALGAYFLLK